jgi:hypothetical protein
MPSRAKAIRPLRTRAPRATRRKLWVHTFYLAQPFLQFFALIAIMLILARCSPLSPSTDKESELQQPAGLAQISQQAEAAALEESIQASLKELSSLELRVISDTELATFSRNLLDLDHPFSEPGIHAHFEQRSAAGLRNRQNILLIPLAPDQMGAFFLNGTLRLDLMERLNSQTQPAAKKLLIQYLRQSMAHKELGALALLVLPDSTMIRVQGAFSDLKVPIRIALGMPSDEAAYLELRRLEEDPAFAQANAVLLEAALKEAHTLAILLE